MAKIKKVKISATKRAQHLKKKKKINFNKNDKSSSNNKTTKNIFDAKKSSFKSVKKNTQKNSIKKQNSNNIDNTIIDDKVLIDNVIDCLDENDADVFNYNNSKNNNAVKSRKRKYTEEIENIDNNASSKLLEKEYTNENIKINNDKKYEIDLLPIKSKDGTIITRTTQISYDENVDNDNENIDNDDNEANEDNEDIVYEDSDDDILQNDNINNTISKKSIYTTDLLILRQQEIEHQKYRIGIICSGILEKPEDKIKNFQLLFNLLNELNENDKPNLLIIRKIACLSICELFKDILPEYRVGQIDPKMIKIRKTTLERIKYENLLLQQFKKYLQILEKITSSCVKKQRFHANHLQNKENIKICYVAVQCLCDILQSHSYFNYVQNIAQLLVYMLNSNYTKIRQIINKCFRTIFVQDKRLDMTIYIIRRINHLIKLKTINNNDIHLDLITCFMSLKIQNINLDAEKESELKQKKLENHRQHLISLSKKEKKRRKRLIELNRELQETKAEDNKKEKNYKLTEIIKMLFTIYFRILKIQPNTKLLSACLEGLAKYSHIINIEYFSDLIEILNNLLNDNELGYREQLYCIQTIFKILSGQGQVLNIDPIRFYNHLYRNLLIINCGKNHNDYIIILNTLNDVLIKRRKYITQSRLLAFIKRILTISLHLLHNGTLGNLCIIKILMQLTSNLDIILDTDNSIGSGKYESELNDPEYCNANCTSLYELNILQSHYHPIVKKMAINILYGAPATGDGSLLPEIGKLTPTELFEMYDTSEMAFNPSIQIPNKTEPKLKKGPICFLDEKFWKFCKEAVKNNVLIEEDSSELNFYEQFRNE